MLDYRFVSTQDSIQRVIDYQAEMNYLSIKPVPLNEIATQKDFFGHDDSFTKMAYFQSALAVSRKIASKGKKEMLSIVEKTKTENEFEF